jgi:hypothetical protein
MVLAEMTFLWTEREYTEEHIDLFLVNDYDGRERSRPSVSNQETSYETATKRGNQALLIPGG